MNPELMHLALRIALKSISKYRLGAVIAKRKKILQVGFNQMGKTHPQMQKYVKGDWTPGLHAEVDCCLGLPAEDLLGADVYVGRIMKNGLPSLARPCEVCQRFLKNVGVRVVYYSTREGWGKIEL
jgi:deoxycytidylate deaminase